MADQTPGVWFIYFLMIWFSSIDLWLTFEIYIYIYFVSGYFLVLQSASTPSPPPLSCNVDLL